MPTTLPKAVFEAGALATKQYGWYYALKGNHRAGDQNAGGRCYDVRDDSRDQVYRPQAAEPTDKQRRARDALWGLSLRKRDEFLLTGHRRGSATTCGADANGFKLFVRSAKDCAKRLDHDSERLIRTYYGPGLTFVWAPGMEPLAEPDVPARGAAVNNGPAGSPAAPVASPASQGSVSDALARAQETLADLILRLLQPIPPS